MSTPESYISKIENPDRRADIERLDRLIRDEAPELARHIRSGMLGYGEYSYRYASGREGEAAVIALASQKRYISLYSCMNLDGKYLAESYVDRLPAADIGRSCVRFRHLADLDEDVLRELVRRTAQMYADDPEFALAARRT